MCVLLTAFTKSSTQKELLTIHLQSLSCSDTGGGNKKDARHAGADAGQARQSHLESGQEDLHQGF
jgi:hypothetical protein